jgi:uncharacterized protein YgfB (UPF0149 family)
MAQNLQVNYAAKHAAVLSLMAELQQAIEDMPSPDYDKLTWANHGDLERLETDLEEILEYLTD